MQGIWKEKLGGWNAKGNKRRKQTRNHTIKDKAIGIIKNYSEEHTDSESYKSDENILTNSTITVHNTYWKKEKKILPVVVKFFKIRLYYDDIDGTPVSKTFRAFEVNGLWLTEDCISIFKSLGLNWKQKHHAFVDKIKLIGEIKPNWTQIKEPNVSFNTSYYPEATTYLYNKPLYDWKRWRLYNHGKRRKYALNKANSADRMALRTFICNQNWDAEIRTHSLSKSILWEVS